MVTMNNIVAVVGNSASGKTAFSIKLGVELSKRKKNVLVISNDIYTPVVPLVYPSASFEREHSIGSLLTEPYITRDAIIKAVITTKEYKYFSLLGYLHGENINTYADFAKNNVEDLLIQLRHIFDYVIIDCPYYYAFDLFASTALDFVDWYYLILSPDLRGLEFYYSQGSVLNILQKPQIKVINQFKDNNSAFIVCDAVKAHLLMPFSEDLHNQYIAGELLTNIARDKKYASASSLLMKMFNELESKYDVKGV